jgi:small subunit ribosomal protein S9
MTSVIQYYGTGRRKTACARVRLVPGQGDIIINGHTLAEYVGGRVGLDKVVHEPFKALDASGRFNVIALVTGGGIYGQMDALRHGISRALAKALPQDRTTLRQGGLLTRDSREKERKKYGRKKARKRFQFSKR